jgi:hypothetical protein
MARFIHLTDERLARRIEKTGIKPAAVGRAQTRYVFATPVLAEFAISHQWLRELKRRGIRTIAAVQFRIPDLEPALVGRYGKQHLETTAAGAVKVVRDHVSQGSGLGLQVMIARKIAPAEITKVYTPPQVAGWRYFPEAHGRAPCGCDYCLLRGEIKSRKIREAYKLK